MSKIITLAVDFYGKEYSALALIKEKGEITEFAITIMNGDLEKLLYGSHTFTFNDGQIKMTSRDDEPYTTTVLKQQIVKSLEEYIFSHPI